MTNPLQKLLERDETGQSNLARKLAVEKEFDESKHPRGAGGKFGAGSSAGSRVPPTEAQVNAALAQWNEIGPIEGKVSPENIDIMARAVEFEGKPSSTELYRGLRVDSVGREGDVVNLPPSSFSPDVFTADPYAAGYGGTSGTILHLPAGTLAFDLAGRGNSYVNDSEQESVVAGQFVIDRVQYGAKDDNGYTWDEKYNHVYLRAVGA